MRSRRFLRKLLVASGVAVLVGVSPCAVAAGESGNVTGGDISGPGAEFADDPDSQAKVALTMQW